jgi:hypothetical protein
MKKFIHTLVLAVFAFGCWLTWVILKLAPVAVIKRANPSLPGFWGLSSFSCRRESVSSR